MSDIAVLTGDLIASTTVEPAAVERAMLALSHTARTFADWTGADTRFTRFRGDGWQFYLTRPGLALRATLFLTAYLRATDPGLATRLSVAVGPHDHLGPTGLSAASGAAFALSGRNLDHMSRTKRQMVFASPEGPSHWWKQAVMDLAFRQAQSWTRQQAEVALLALTPQTMTQEQMARSLGITRQAVQLRLKGAGVSALAAGLFAFEETP